MRLKVLGIASTAAIMFTAIAAAPAAASTDSAKRSAACEVDVYTNGHDVKAKCRKGVKKHNRYRIISEFCSTSTCRWIGGSKVHAPHWSHVHSSGYYANHTKIVSW